MTLRAHTQRSRALQAAGFTLLTLSAVALYRAPIAQADRPADRLIHGQRPAAPRLAESPLRFEPNVGQLEQRVRYLARGEGYGLYLTTEGATLVLQRRTPGAEGGKHPTARGSIRSEARDERVVSMHLAGAKSVEPSAGAPQTGTNNYFAGNDRTHWQTGIPSFASVHYDDVLPGVSLTYYGAAGQALEYDIVLAPGADPTQLELVFDGIDSTRIGPDGSALLQLPGGGELKKLPPVAFQMNAAGARVEVASHYEARKNGALGVVVGAYDATRPLVIDPVLLYSTYLGGGSTDEAFGVATDSLGNTYVVGYTTSTLFPTISPEQPVHGGGVDDVFIAKVDPSGNFVYSTFLGGNGADVGYAIAADTAGNAYVTGVTYSTNFPTVSPIQASPGGMQDVFVAKLNALGSALIFSTYLGGSQDDSPGGIAVGVFGNTYLTGTTSSSNFPLQAPLQASLQGVADAFVSNLSPSGSTLAYSTYLGGAGYELGHAIAVDGSGNAFVGGSTSSATTFPLATPLQGTFGGGSYDGFVSKLNSAGSALVYSTYLGGLFTDEVMGVATSSAGVATVTGYTSSTNFPVVSAPQSTLGSNGFTDAFVSRLSVAGNGLFYSTYLGGGDDDRGAAVGVDSKGNAYVVGSTLSANFPVANPISGQGVYRGASDGFVTALDPSGATFAYSTYLGGTAEDHATGVAVQPNGTTHVVGSTFSTNFPMVSAPIGTLVGGEDTFIARLPGISASIVPACGRWSIVFLSGILLGLGLLFLPLTKRRLASVPRG